MSKNRLLKTCKVFFGDTRYSAIATFSVPQSTRTLPGNGNTCIPERKAVRAASTPLSEAQATEGTILKPSMQACIRNFQYISVIHHHAITNLGLVYRISILHVFENIELPHQLG